MTSLKLTDFIEIELPIELNIAYFLFLIWLSRP